MLIPDRITRYKITKEYKEHKKVVDYEFYKTGNEKIDSFDYRK